MNETTYTINYQFMNETRKMKFTDAASAFDFLAFIAKSCSEYHEIYKFDNATIDYNLDK